MPRNLPLPKVTQLVTQLVQFTGRLFLKRLEYSGIAELVNAGFVQVNSTISTIIFLQICSVFILLAHLPLAQPTGRKPDKGTTQVGQCLVFTWAKPLNWDEKGEDVGVFFLNDVLGGSSQDL